MTERSYNGWPTISKDGASWWESPSLTRISVPGGWTLTVCGGDVASIFKRFATDYAAKVEPLISQPYGYEYRKNVNNAGQWSCHASGTAIDLNAPKHPNGTKAPATFGPGQIAAVHELLAFYTPLRWIENSDPMHFEINVDSTALHTWLMGTVIVDTYPLLKIGSVGPWVTAWQQYMRANYKWAASLVVDGKYGEDTAAKTAIFQSALGLSVDGVAGPKTLSAAAHYAAPFSFARYRG